MNGGSVNTPPPTYPGDIPPGLYFFLDTVSYFEPGEADGTENQSYGTRKNSDLLVIGLDP